MIRGLRTHLNVALLGFVITFVIYLFVRFDTDKIITGLVIAGVGGGLAVAVYAFALWKFGGEEPELYDKDGNQVDRSGRIVKRKS